MSILLTGAAGFIGMHTAVRLLDAGEHVVGVDNFDPYYDPQLKESRAAVLMNYPNFTLERADLADSEAVTNIFASTKPRSVIHLAAQPGVRHGIDHPRSYVRANLAASLNIFEEARKNSLRHVVYASSSSVYGDFGPRPSNIEDRVDHPISLYAATKKSNELTAHAYASLHGLPCSGLRFFTVYGPYGRPDMATWKFTQRMLAGETIEVYGGGHHRRDFTCVQDIAEGIVRVHEHTPTSIDKKPPCRIFNIGNSAPVPLMDFIRELENALNVKAQIKMLPKQPGDVNETHADVSALSSEFNWSPKTPLSQGLKYWADWYRTHYPE